MNRALLVVSLALTLLWTACGKSAPSASPAPAVVTPTPASPAAPAPSVEPPAPAPTAPAATVAPPKPPAATGEVRISYAPGKTTAHREMAAELREAKIFDAVAAELSGLLRLERDLPLRFAACDEPNAYYDDEKSEITMCYELIDSFATAFAAYYPAEADVAVGVTGAVLFTLYHELGHALVDRFQLPITGKEENAVDQLATYLLLDGTAEGTELALAGAEAFLHEAEADAETGEPPAYWGEHATGEQRFYNVLCWVYGSNPAKYDPLVDDEDGLPEQRAELCEGEWETLKRAWDKLLAPHRR